MILEPPNILDIPIFGRLESAGGAASLVEKLSDNGAIGILCIGQLELHIENHFITHANHPGLEQRQAALAILQVRRGNYQFFAQPIHRSMHESVHSLALIAMQHLDEATQSSQKMVKIVLPNLSIALEYLRGIGGFVGWHAYPTEQGMLLQRDVLQIATLSGTLEELRILLQHKA